jgi:outer membrane protein OmpA-like peptidoglycan-associated protein
MPSGDAVNMGVVINTSGDEASPYYNSKTGELVFSSNGRVGLGGFDLYESDGTIGAGNWSEPKDLGYPVNSAKDDNFYYPSGKEGNFYTSSDRESVCCMELFNIQLSHIAITGTVRDCDSAKPLPGVEVTLTDSISHKTIGSRLTDDAGHYRFTVINRKPLKLHFDKDEYFSKSAIITTNDLSQVDTLFSNEICMNHFVIGKPIVIPNIEYDFNKATLRPESESVLDSLAQILKDNPKLIVQMRSYTDSIGSFDYNRKLSQRRAQSCVDYLLSQGIPSYRMSAKGYGETDPIAPNSLPDGKDNPAGRQKNRRTAFVVLKD